MNFRKTSLAIASIIIPGVMVLSQGLTQAQALVGLDGGGGPITPPVNPVIPPVGISTPEFVTKTLPDGIAGNRYRVEVTVVDRDKNDTLTLNVYGLNSTFKLSNCRNKFTSAGSSIKCQLSGKLDTQKGYYPVYFVARDSQGHETWQLIYINVR